MDGGLTIASLVLDARRFASEQLIPFAERPWRPSSEIIWSDKNGTEPIVRDGKRFEYFIEPFIIIEQFESFLDGCNKERLVDRVIQYAEHDA